MSDERIDISMNMRTVVEQKFASLEEALRWAAPLARKFKGRALVSVIRKGQWYAVTSKRHATNKVAFLEGFMVGWDEDDGFTLVEVLVSMMIGSMLIAMLTAALVSGANSTKALTQLIADETSAQSRLEHQMFSIHGGVYAAEPNIILSGVGNGGGCFWTGTATIGQSGRVMSLSTTSDDPSACQP